MEWIEVSVIETTQKSYDQFCRAVDIWIRRPNVVNKQLSHATPIVSGVSYEKWPSLVENLSQRAREEPIKTCLEEEANSERLRLRIRSLVPKNKDRSEGLQYDAIIEGGKSIGEITSASYFSLQIKTKNVLFLCL